MDSLKGDFRSLLLSTLRLNTLPTIIVKLQMSNFCEINLFIMVILLQIAKLAKNSFRVNIVLNKKVCYQSLTERNFRGKKQHFIPQNLVVY